MRTAKWVVAVVVAVLVAGACGGDGDDEAEAPRGEATTTTGPVPAAEPGDSEAAEAEIRATFERVFDSDTPPAEALALAEDAEGIGPTLEQSVAASPGGRRTVDVKSVTFVKATNATVVFDIVLDGNVLLPGFAGGAVFEEGVWKVSRKTNCDLAAMAGFSCPAVDAS